MNWKLHVATAAALAAGLCVTGWAVSASGKVSSPDLGPAVVARPSPHDDPPPGDKTAVTESPSPAPSVADEGEQGDAGGAPVTVAPATVAPRWIEPPDDDDDDDDEHAAEADDD
ncbi:MAG TPA: hypothetical protein VFO77_10510 [Actinoplanes sp.]|nr:hypothetical protein [Actinoplanes sp.]